MFARLGTFAARHRWLILAAWLAAAAVITLVAPNIEDVAVNDQRAFLPSQAASLDAIRLMEELFPDRVSPSSAVIVFDSGRSRGVEDPETAAFLEETSEWLAGEEAPGVIERVLSPVEADERTAQALQSADGQVSLVVVSFSTIGPEPVTREAVKAIEARLEGAPEGLQTYVTGDAAIIGAYDEATKESLDNTTIITVGLVILILLLIYRSPVSPLIPLLSITMAYLISRGVIALLGDGVITISGYTNIFLIVVLFGAGTDYCLFLISRFREEMARQPGVRAATERTVHRVGETITSSAATVVVGLSTMALAELGLFNTTGPSIAIGVVIGLAAGLTLTPALLAILGTRAFWPRRPEGMGEGRFWRWWAGRVTGRPGLALVITLVVLLPLAFYGRGQSRDFDLLGDLPDEVPARQGFHVLAEHLGPGTMLPLNVVVRGEEFGSAAGLRQIEAAATEMEKVAHVQQVRSFTSNLEEGRTLVVAEQLGDRMEEVAAGRALLASSGEEPPGPAQVEEAQTGLIDLFGYLQQLGQEYPDVRSNPGYLQAVGGLAALAQAFGIQPGQTTPPPTSSTGVVPPAARQGLDDLASGLTTLRHEFVSRPDSLMLPSMYLRRNEELRNLAKGYIAADGDATRLQVVLDTGPYSPEALSAVEDLRGFGQVEGSSAVVADLKDASARDMVKSIIWVLAGILVVLILLLRSLVAPLYLIITILISYGATLGIVRLVFSDLLGGTGVTWWVPIFMFVMLVALGMDYNIFLMGRVKEEAALRGNSEGTREAVSRTGGIITSAGIIMAGTFGALMAGSILGLVQIGFAVAVGVLLDTFVVRTALVPALAVLLGRWSWWPRRGPRAFAEEQELPSENA